MCNVSRKKAVSSFISRKNGLTWWRVGYSTFGGPVSSLFDKSIHFPSSVGVIRQRVPMKGRVRLRYQISTGPSSYLK